MPSPSEQRKPSEPPTGPVATALEIFKRTQTIDNIFDALAGNKDAPSAVNRKIREDLINEKAAWTWVLLGLRSEPELVFSVVITTRPGEKYHRFSDNVVGVGVVDSNGKKIGRTSTRLHALAKAGGGIKVDEFVRDKLKPKELDETDAKSHAFRLHSEARLIGRYVASHPGLSSSEKRHFRDLRDAIADKLLAEESEWAELRDFVTADLTEGEHEKVIKLNFWDKPEDAATEFEAPDYLNLSWTPQRERLVKNAGGYRKDYTSPRKQEPEPASQTQTQQVLLVDLSTAAS